MFRAMMCALRQKFSFLVLFQQLYPKQTLLKKLYKLAFFHKLKSLTKLKRIAKIKPKLR